MLSGSRPGPAARTAQPRLLGSPVEWPGANRADRPESPSRRSESRLWMHGGPGMTQGASAVSSGCRWAELRSRHAGNQGRGVARRPGRLRPGDRSRDGGVHARREARGRPRDCPSRRLGTTQRRAAGIDRRRVRRTRAGSGRRRHTQGGTRVPEKTEPEATGWRGRQPGSCGRSQHAPPLVGESGGGVVTRARPALIVDVDGCVSPVHPVEPAGSVARRDRGGPALRPGLRVADVGEATRRPGGDSG